MMQLQKKIVKPLLCAGLLFEAALLLTPLCAQAQTPAASEAATGAGPAAAGNPAGRPPRGPLPQGESDGRRPAPPVSVSTPGTIPTNTPWGTPTLADWNSVWSAYRGPLIRPQRLYIEPTPLYAPYMKAAEEAQKKGMEVGHGAKCLPSGMPNVLGLVYPAEFIVRPHQVNIIYEYTGDRRIRMNSTHPDFVEPSFRGDSIGHWEGDTLVIDTVGITTKTVFVGGARHSNQLRVTERLREIAPGVIENKIHLEDPLAFAKPVDYSVGYQRTPKEDVFEHACENNVEGDQIKNVFDAFELMPEPPQPEVHWAKP